MLKSSKWIKKQAEENQLITPFLPESVREGVISFGLGPYGYDIRLDKTYKIIDNKVGKIDPYQVDNNDFQIYTKEEIIIPPQTFILGKSVEYFKMPKKILGIVFGKSTYARCGILINVTPIEPEWSGFLTISISNVSGKAAILYPFQGIAQVIFLSSHQLPLFSYKDLKGQYNEQKEITISKINKLQRNKP